MCIGFVSLARGWSKADHRLPMFRCAQGEIGVVLWTEADPGKANAGKHELDK
jgi:hypothetical protein